MFNLSSKIDVLSILVKNYAKTDMKFFWLWLIFVDLFNFCQIFCLVCVTGQILPFKSLEECYSDYQVFEYKILWSALDLKKKKMFVFKRKAQILIVQSLVLCKTILALVSVKYDNLLQLFLKISSVQLWCPVLIMRKKSRYVLAKKAQFFVVQNLKNS